MAQARTQRPKAKTQKRSHRTAVSKAEGRLPHGDYPLIAATAALLVFGLMMVYSASYDIAYRDKGDAAYYLVRQVLWMLLGIGVAVAVARSDFASWRRWSVVLMGGSLLLLVLVLVGGSERFGAQRTLFGGSIQPSEIAKLVLIVYIADWLASKGEKIQDANYGLVPFALIVGVVTGLILAEPDYGMAILIVLTAGAMFFMAGVELKQLLLGIAVAGLTLGVLMLVTSHTRNRLDQFVDPAKMSEQMKRVTLALQMGGLTGVGLGNGMLQLSGYLPLAHTDTIFSLLAAETGLVGVVILLSLYGIVAYRGYHIALNAANTYGRLLAFGATTSIILQALINVCVMTGTMPLTGMTLPFVSYGGSSMVSVLGAVGVLFSVSRGTRKGIVYGALMDRGRRDRRSRVSRLVSR